MLNAMQWEHESTVNERRFYRFFEQSNSYWITVYNYCVELLREVHLRTETLVVGNYPYAISFFLGYKLVKGVDFDQCL